MVFLKQLSGRLYYGAAILGICLSKFVISLVTDSMSSKTRVAQLARCISPG